VLMVQPRIVFVSSGAPSADNLFRERSGSRGGDSPGSKGRPTAWIASGTADGARAMLEGVSRKVVMMVGRAGSNGMPSGRYLGAGTRCWSGD
jgi:hypothetical protein